MNPDVPPRQSLTHDQWTKTMTVLAATHPDPSTQELATFCAGVLTHCGDTPELTEFLNGRALQALDAGGAL